MLTKHQLKSIVKECLIEILSEGIGERSRSARMTADRYPIQESRSTSAPRQQRRRSSSLDNVSYGRGSDNPIQAHQRQDIDTLTSDPLMASIFADTQTTTMRSQVEGRGSMNESVALQGDMAARTMSQNDPMDVFGDASSNWAHLAFSDK